jgi:hypothetical protein
MYLRGRYFLKIDADPSMVTKFILRHVYRIYGNTKPPVTLFFPEPGGGGALGQTGPERLWKRHHKTSNQFTKSLCDDIDIR